MPKGPANVTPSQVAAQVIERRSVRGRGPLPEFGALKKRGEGDVTERHTGRARRRQAESLALHPDRGFHHPPPPDHRHRDQP